MLKYGRKLFKFFFRLSFSPARNNERRNQPRRRTKTEFQSSCMLGQYPSTIHQKSLGKKKGIAISLLWEISHRELTRHGYVTRLKLFFCFSFSWINILFPSILLKEISVNYWKPFVIASLSILIFKRIILPLASSSQHFSLGVFH